MAESFLLEWKLYNEIRKESDEWVFMESSIEFHNIVLVLFRILVALLTVLERFGDALISW